MMSARAYAPTIEVQPKPKRHSDERNSAARQLRRLIELAYANTEYSYARIAWFARDLGIDRKTVASNYKTLEALKLIEIVRNKRRIRRVYPLPRLKNKKLRRQTWTAQALATKQLNLSYRLLWLLQEKSWHGNPVKISQRALVIALATDRRHLHHAIGVNVRRGTLKVDPGGRGKVDTYHLLGAFRIPRPRPVDDGPDPFDDSQSIADYVAELPLPDRSRNHRNHRRPHNER